MSELSEPHNHDPAHTHAAIAEIVKEQIGLIVTAAEAIGGVGVSVVEVFEQPPDSKARDLAPMPDWTDDQIKQVREVAHKLGYGIEIDLSSGLHGGARIIEGGKPWKIAAEVEALAVEDSPTTLIFAGGSFRKQEDIGDDERAFMKDVMDVELPVDASEYDVARIFAERQIASPLEEPKILSIGYEIAEGNPTLQTPTGQMIELGKTAQGQNVQLLRIDQGFDERGKPQNRLMGHRVMTFIADVLKAQGQEQDPIGLVTSSTYASRVIGVLGAGLVYERQFGVTMYGRRTIANVTGEPMKDDSPLNQLSGDLRVSYDNLVQFSSELQ